MYRCRAARAVRINSTGYTARMQPIAVLLECAELTDDDLEDLKNFLEVDEAVDHVTIGYLAMVDSGLNAPIEIHAAAAPFIFSVHILRKHWEAITVVAGAVTGGVTMRVNAASWVKKKTNAFNDSRDAKYDQESLYDAERDVHRLVKVRNK